MAGDLTGRKVAVLATDGVEQVELTAPWNALKEARADVSLISIKKGAIQGFIREEKRTRSRSARSRGMSSA